MTGETWTPSSDGLVAFPAIDRSARSIAGVGGTPRRVVTRRIGHPRPEITIARAKSAAPPIALESLGGES